MSNQSAKGAKSQDLVYVPTEEQQAIIEVVPKGPSLMVKAYAGCAKTTTLVMAAQRIKVPALALAFNKAIAQELVGRVPGNFSVKTMNGLGFGAWVRARPGTSFTIDEKKLGKLVSQVAKDRKVELSSDQWDGLRRLVSGAMLAGIVPGDQGNPLTSDTFEEWADIGDHLWIDRADFELLYEMAREVLVTSIDLAKHGAISFDDQVYCSTCLGGIFPKFPFLVVDEAQDLSPLNHRMLALAMRSDGRMLAVGDPCQAIYAFRGASSDSMDKISALRPEWTQLPLATTFRCPKAVVARQQGHAPGFRAAPGNRDGTVERAIPLGSLDEFQVETGGWDWPWLQRRVPASSDGRERATLAVLCRNNAPLLVLAFKFIRRGVGPVMLGRDIGKGLIALSKKIEPNDASPRDIIAGKITEWLESENSLAIANGQEEKIAGLNDRAGCLRAVLDSAEVKDAGQLRFVLGKLFAREAGEVTLGSIHRAKGLEWDAVVHLDPWRIPSKWAKEAALLGDNRQLQQEYNLLYVCETRTKNVLINASLEDFV